MAETGRLMAGLTAKSLKKHPSLLPLLFAVGLGATGAAGYVFRLATRNPDVCWDRKNNPYPWQKLKPTDQYKFYAARHDYSSLRRPVDKPDL